MSNYIVHPEHINVMLWAGMQIGRYRGRPIEWKENPGELNSTLTDVLEPPVADYVGQMLLEANQHAVEGAEPLIYAYRPPAHKGWSLLEVLAAIECYEAQTRRRKGWPRTPAHAFCRALELAVLRQLVRQLPSTGGSPNYHLTDQSTPSEREDIANFPVPGDPEHILWAVVRRRRVGR
ncbi:hypothetical protein [Mycobacteroides abscessus]|uniref:hypothetical protein n=1 Tax=Mycobacteroides abscessus TaxID=36809 RepID=UPI000928C106|nr:hypothetical protein [Mycobacteroides abscessus]SIC19362.1 Uncharacterised protein [Mycobacteroides abscessus subsp. abscessus]